MAPDGYLRGILGDGDRPVRHRSGVRELLGVPDDGVRIVFPAQPRGGFVYRRISGEPPREQAAAAGGWLMQVVDDPSDPWPGEPPAGPAHHAGRAWPIALAPPVRDPVTSVGSPLSRSVTRDGLARPVPGEPPPQPLPQPDGPLTADPPAPDARGFPEPVPARRTSGPAVTTAVTTTGVTIPEVTIPGVTQAARRSSPGARAPSAGALSPVRDARPQPPRPAGPAQAPATRVGDGPARGDGGPAPAPGGQRLRQRDDPFTRDPAGGLPALTTDPAGLTTSPSADLLAPATDLLAGSPAPVPRPTDASRPFPAAPVPAITPSTRHKPAQPGTQGDGGPARSPSGRRPGTTDRPLMARSPMSAPESSPEPAPSPGAPAAVHETWPGQADGDPACSPADPVLAQAHGAGPVGWAAPGDAAAAGPPRPGDGPRRIAPHRVTPARSAAPDAVSATRSGDPPLRRARLAAPPTGQSMPPAGQSMPPAGQGTPLARPAGPVDRLEPPATTPGPPPPPPVVVVPPEPAGQAAFWERRHVGRLRARIPR